MRLRGFGLFLAGLVVLCLANAGLAAEPANPPDLKEVYDLIRTHLAGVNESILDRTAVNALVAALAPKVALVSGDTNSTTTGPLITKTNLFEGDIGYIRVGRVGEGLAEGMRKATDSLRVTNKLKGLVIDLRFAPGTDYAAAASTANLFIAKERPLLNWGKGVVRSEAKNDAFNQPLAILVNHQTEGAAEALAAVVRETGSGLILGNRTAGQAMIAEEFPLKNGERLRVATEPIQLGDGTSLGPQGVEPDIAVRVSPEEERAYFADAFRVLNATNAPLFASTDLSLTNAPSGTNRTRRPRFNEAELVRERRDGAVLDSDLLPGRPAETEKPTVHDPVLARALDLLKGLAVVRQSHS